MPKIILQQIYLYYIHGQCLIPHNFFFLINWYFYPFFKWKIFLLPLNTKDGAVVEILTTANGMTSAGLDVMLSGLLKGLGHKSLTSKIYHAVTLWNL